MRKEKDTYKKLESRNWTLEEIQLNRFEVGYSLSNVESPKALKHESCFLNLLPKRILTNNYYNSLSRRDRVERKISDLAMLQIGGFKLTESLSTILPIHANSLPLIRGARRVVLWFNGSIANNCKNRDAYET